MGTTLKEIEPAIEIKKKWYFWITIIYLLFLWCPTIITINILEVDIIPALEESSKTILVISNIGLITGIIVLLVLFSCFIARKYLEKVNYGILDTEITITKGLIVKRKTVIPYRTITNLIIKQGPVDLLLGISKVIIQTAGEATNAEPEGKLIGIYYAKDLIEEILNLVRLLDPLSYLRERVPLTTTPKNIITLYAKILSKLQIIEKKIKKRGDN
ncbi:MAG: PH domain-containing protein [Asgard group archaeon]|nr:PH domain-containing protein [Asgard group archaeon]